MPICSYLVFPKPGAEPKLLQTLNALPGCDAMPAENRDDVMVLVTETESKADANDLEESLKNIEDIQCLVLTFGEVENLSNTVISQA